MRAMVLAAGLGSRLLPLTANWPKCLMPVANTPLLELALQRLASLRAQEVVVNTHYLADLVSDYVLTSPFDLHLHISHETELLGTGGALVKAGPLLGQDPFWLMNADVWCNADLSALPALMQKHKAIACLGLVDEPRFNSVAVDSEMRVLAVKGYAPVPANSRLYTYSGLAWLHPRLLSYLPTQGPSNLVDAWHRAMAEREPIIGVRLQGQWSDLGTWQDLWRANAAQAKGGMILLDSNANIDPVAKVEGFCFMGPGSRIEANAKVKNSVLLPGAVVAGQAENAIIGKDAIFHGSLCDGVFA